MASSSCPEITAVHTPWIARYYDVLARIDLRGQDAANLYHPHCHDRDEALTSEYRRLDTRAQLALQVAPMRWREDAGEMPGHLSRILPPGNLKDAFFEVLEREERGGGGQKIFDFLPPSSPLLDATQRALGALYELNPEKRPVRILIHDVPAMRDGAWTHGRALYDGEQMHVALSTRAKGVYAALQLFHELTHPITDPLVRASGAHEAAQATSVTAPGYALHAALEACVVEVDAAIIAARVPEWQKPFDAWCARYGI